MAMRDVDAGGRLTEDVGRLELRAERLRVGTVAERMGAARLTTRVVETTETVAVPLREERVVIERLVGGAEVLVDGRPLAEGERVELVTRRERVRVATELIELERLDIRIEAVERRATVSAALREERLVVEARGDLLPQPPAPRPDR